MKLQSISSPMRTGTEVDTSGEGRRPSPVTTERITPVPSETPPPLTDPVRRRIVVGKSDRLVVPRADTGLESVIGVDERTRIVTTAESPWKLICALEIEAPWGNFIGTGWVVAPRTLITAGHCVFDKNQMGGWASKITVTPGRERERAPFGTIETKRFSALDAWIERQDPDFDIAAIHLDHDLFPAADAFRVGALPDAELKDYLVNVGGYPGTPGGGTELWWAKNRITALTPRRIFYEVDTSGGQSGGPVFIYPDENAHPIVVGIHAYGEGGTPASMPMRVNSAPRIIPEVVEQIESWILGGGSGT